MRKTFIFISFFVIVGILVGSAMLFTTIRYPLKYEDEITKYSAEYSLDKNLVASIINEESSFNKGAVSSKGACGLMQLTPSTAKFICHELGQEYDENNLFVPKKNIEYGCFYLNYLRKKFVDEKVYLSAYNAGESNVRLWLNDSSNSKDGVTLYKIPYTATSEYVNKIISGKKMYQGRF